MWRGALGTNLVALGLSFSLAGCGGSDDSASNADDPGLGGTSQGGAGSAGKGASGQGGAGAGTAGQGGAGTGGAAGKAGGAGSSGQAGGGQSGGAQAGQAGGGQAGGGQAGSGQAGQGGAGQAGAAGSGNAGVGGGGSAGAGGSAAGAGQAGTAGAAGVGGTSGGGGGGGSGPTCKAPDVLIVLDRTQSMHFRPDGVNPTDAPDYQTSKWYQAITGLKEMTAAPLDAQIRFGLELWPPDPGGGQCVTLAQRIAGTQATNPQCETGTVVVPNEVNQGQKIAALLDPATTTLCISTPTGSALQAAHDYLKAQAEEGREQYVMLVTDGADWDLSCPDPAPVPIVQQLAADGIKTFVVGFSAEATVTGGVGLEFLNDMACAGETAKGFPGSCKQAAGGYVATDNKASPLFLRASDATQLSQALQSVASSLCCGCVPNCDPPEVLFALDRTQSMHFTPQGVEPVDAPDYKTSKWYQAIAAIKQVTAASDQNFRYGLELWPRDPGGDACVTLAQRVAGTQATNAQCEAGEVVVPPSIGQGGAIAAAIDPATTKLCISTPTGNALITAGTQLTSNFTPGRAQYVALVTDGADWDLSCPDPNPVLQVQKLAASGIKTFIVGFYAAETSPSGVGIGFLNDMACAGQTAKGFPAPCKPQDGGYVASDPNSPPLFQTAEDSSQLESVLTDSFGSIRCHLD